MVAGASAGGVKALIDRAGASEFGLQAGLFSDRQLYSVRTGPVGLHGGAAARALHAGQERARIAGHLVLSAG